MDKKICDKEVIILVGFTKAKKSSVARTMANIANAEIIEMSSPFRESLEDKSTLKELLESLNLYRKSNGEISLAVEALRKIKDTNKNIIILAGLRNYKEYLYLKNNINKIRTVFIYSSTQTRHKRLRKDSRSIAKTTDDYKLLDILAVKEGIRSILPDVDHVIVNEIDFPLTRFEQIRNILREFKEKKMSDQGVTITKLPVYHGKQDNMEVISRILKPKGELATISIDQINYLAYVDFPLDGKPRANHFHEEKDEYLYLIKGKVKLLVRRGGNENDEVKEYIVDAGSLIHMQPGYAHAYITLEEGYAIEYSPTSYEVIKRDKVRDYVVK